MPGDAIAVRLTYSERLPFFEDGRAELRLPLVVAPRYVAGEELPREQAGHGVVRDTASVPDASRISPPRLAKGFDPKVALAIEVEMFGGFTDLSCSQHAVRTSSGPESARVSLSREREPLDRDFVLRWRLAGEQVKSHVLVHGGFALLSVLPPARDGFTGTPRDVIFVLDRSGSMQGAKMASASRACALLLRTLGPRDRFALQCFDEVVAWMSPGFQQADEGSIDRGEKWLRAVAARGGTELGVAMAEALGAMRARGETAGRVPVIVLLTDGQVGDESRVLKKLQAELGDARVFTVGIDTAVNDGFLRRLAAIGGGTSTFVEPGTRLEEALEAVGREIGTPLVTELRISGEVAELAPARIPDLFAGRPATAFFRHGGGKVKVTGKVAGGGRFEEEIEPREAPLAAVDHLWARARIADLEDEFRASQSESAKKEIIALSTRHTVLTRFTAFVAIDDQVVNSGAKPRTVVQPVEMPAEWEMDAFAQMFGGTALAGPVHPAGAPNRTRAMSHMPPVSAQASSPTASIPRRLMQALVRRQPREDQATDGQREKVREALEGFLRALGAARAGNAGADELERARVDLLRVLGESLPIAMALPLLQAFLRGAAVDLIASLARGSADAALFARWDRALHEACEQARLALGSPSAGAGEFWESTI
jgi:Ca-activated chloride channel homolog